MSLSIVTFANLGKKQNLKTPDILPVIDTFEKRGELDQIICQINSDFFFINTASAIPKVLRYLLRVIEKTFCMSLPRRMTERLIDTFAARRLAHADLTLLHGGYFLPKTTCKAKLLGSITVDLTVTAHLRTNAIIEKEELRLLGIKGFEGVFTTLAREVVHDNNFDYIIALSEFVKESYVESGFPTDRIFIAHPDVDTLRFHPNGDKRDDIFRVLYIAYTTPLKGLQYLLDAWNTLNLPHTELVLVGGYGAMPEELKERYGKSTSQNTNIIWENSAQDPERYYRDASVFVFPSLTEGFGRVTLEAMACGIPVITTENARGIVEDGKTGFIVPIWDANAIAEKIRYLYDHRDIAEEMGREARRAVENKKPFGEAVYEIYQEILQREHLKPERDTIGRTA